MYSHKLEIERDGEMVVVCVSHGRCVGGSADCELRGLPFPGTDVGLEVVKVERWSGGCGAGRMQLSGPGVLETLRGCQPGTAGVIETVYERARERERAINQPWFSDQQS